MSIVAAMVAVSMGMLARGWQSTDT